MPHTYTNIAIDGGGPRVCVYLGALAAVGNLKNVRRFMGVSVGALIAVMLAMDYTIGDILNIANHTSLREHMVPSLRDLLNACKKGGILGNDKLTLLVDAHIATALGRKNATFLDLYTKFGRELIVVAASIQTHQPRYFCVRYCTAHADPACDCYVVHGSAGGAVSDVPGRRVLRRRVCADGATGLL